MDTYGNIFRGLKYTKDKVNLKKNSYGVTTASFLVSDKGTCLGLEDFNMG